MAAESTTERSHGLGHTFVFDVDTVARFAEEHGILGQASAAAADLVDLTERIARLKTLHGITLLVDSREHVLADFLRAQSWVRVESLPVCDFLFVDKEGRPLVGYERKAQADLVHSIKNNHNHYQDQKRRMLELGARVLNVVLEGSSPKNRMFELNCESKTVLRDGMNWRRTSGLLDTLRMLFRDALAVFELGPDSVGLPQVQAAHNTFQGMARKDPDPKLQFVRMLCDVNGFSGSKAKAVADAYGSMAQLVNCFSEADVAELQYQPRKSENLRRVGPASASKLRQALFAETGPPKLASKPQRKKSSAKTSTAKKRKTV
jgi:ERCC4-type nuclease